MQLAQPLRQLTDELGKRQAGMLWMATGQSGHKPGGQQAVLAEAEKARYRDVARG
jgi:hypothetical protein